MKKDKIKVHTGIVTLGMGHSLICSGQEEQLQPLDGTANFLEMQRSYGLYSLGSSSVLDEFTTLKQEKAANPTENFIHPIFRGLSEVIVRKQWDPIDFTEKGVLKDSLKLLEGQTVYTNHFAYIGNQVGVVTKAFWDSGHTSEGFKIPAGINLVMKIDAKNNPKLADSLQMDPPAIHSNSVTVNFKWEPSHKEMSYQEFRSKVGTYDDKGQLIRRIVTEITGYYETSLVSNGADPYAKMIGKDGKIINPSMAASRDSFSLELAEQENRQGASPFFFFSHKEESFSLEAQIENLSEESQSQQTNQKTHKTKEEMKLSKSQLLFLAALSGFAVPDQTASLSEEEFAENFPMDDFVAHLGENPVAPEKTHTELQETVNSLTTQVETLTEEKNQLTQQLSQQAPTLDQQELVEYRQAELAELERVYALVEGSAPTDQLKTKWGKANLSSLQIVKETYQEKLEAKYPIKCNKCNSTEVSRATTSSTTGMEEEGGKVVDRTNESPLEKAQRLRSLI